MDVDNSLTDIKEKHKVLVNVLNKKKITVLDKILKLIDKVLNYNLVDVKLSIENDIYQNVYINIEIIILN